MVSIFTPARRESSPIDKAAADREAADDIKIPLAPVVTTGCSTIGMVSQTQNETDLDHSEAQSETVLRAQKLLSVGGVLGALAASSCCVVPLALFGLGVSGAWISNLTQLAPYQPYFIAVTVACLGGGYWLRYHSRKTACAEGEVCALPLPNRIAMIGFLLATVLVIDALALDFFASFFL
jgi:mercuric ion transport protein